MAYRHKNSPVYKYFDDNYCRDTFPEKEKMQIIKIFLSILFLMSFSASYIGAGEKYDLYSLVSEADAFKEKKAPFLYCEAYKSNDVIGYCFNTIDLVPDEKGYGGPIEIIVFIDKEGKIKNLNVIKHSETLEYAAGITKQDFLGQFKEKSIADKFVVGEDINAVTHATVSSAAFAGIVKKSLEKMQVVLSGSKKGNAEIDKLTKAGLMPREAKYYTVIE
jgi:transcriptional regulator of nitric oxide reductase